MTKEHEALRLEIERQVREYLDKGGKITQLPSGTQQENKRAYAWDNMTFAEYSK